jgi:geranylgeranyl reductase family protein
MKPADYDVAVVGAGPAGTTAARHLAAGGARTVLLERARLPRYKSCAGGIPVRTLHELPFPIDAVTEDIITGIRVSYHGRPQFDRLDGDPFARMVMRDRFDQLLAERAVDAGAELVDDAAVRSIEAAAGGYELQTERGPIRATFVVGADGANSVVARCTGLGSNLAQACALEAEVAAPLAVHARWRGLVNVDFGYRPAGYGWLFPKQRLVSVGLVLPRDFAGRLRDYLAVYLQRLGLGSANVERLVGHKVLFRRARERIAGEGALLAGDAAGLADEFTEEGIFYAVHSGMLAARALLGALGGGYRSLSGYERSVDRDIMPELHAARTIARLFYGCMARVPALMLQVSDRIDYLWRAFFRVQRGESSYAAVLRRARVVDPVARLVLR